MDANENAVRPTPTAYLSPSIVSRFTNSLHIKPSRMSQLRPPSRLPMTPGRGLSEVSESDNNVRTMPTGIPRVSNVPIKRKPTGRRSPLFSKKEYSNLQPVSGPAAKQRKTLVEQAAEPLNHRVNSQSVSGAIQVCATGFRSTSGSSSGTSRTSRNISATSSNSSLGGTLRPTSSLYNYKPQQMGSNQYKYGAQTPMITPRSAGLLDENPFEAPISIPGQRDRKLPTNAPAMGEFNLHPSRNKMDAFHKSPYRNISITTSMARLSLQCKIPTTSKIVEEPLEPSVQRKTKSHIPQPVPSTPCSTVTQHTPLAKRTRPSLSPTKSRASYLTRFSDTLTARDMAGRLEDMERDWRDMKEGMQEATSVKATLQHEVAAKLNKSKSIYELHDNEEPWNR